MPPVTADPEGLLVPLASARGDLDVVRQLIKGQYGKRLLQLRQAAETPAASAAGRVTPQRASYALLARVQREQPGVFRSLLLEPDTAVWLGSREARRCALGHIAAAAAILSRCPASVTVPVTAGVLFIPGLGEAIIAGGRATGPAVVHVASDGVSVTTDDTRLRLPDDLTATTDCWRPIRRLFAGTDTRLSARFAVNGPIVGAVSAFCALGTAPDETDWQPTLDEAWRILENSHPVHAASIAAGVRAIVPLAPAEDGSTVSMTLDSAFGAIAMSLPSRPDDLAVNLIHEFQHAKLAAALDLVRLHTPSNSALYYAPWRPDPRPLAAVLQGIYAHLGVAQFWGTQRQLDGQGRSLREHVLFVRWRDDTWRACREIADAPELTAAGRTFVSMLLAELERLRSEEVRPESRRLADLIAREQKVLWRLRNLDVDHETARRLAVAWLNGDAPVALPAGMTRHRDAPRTIQDTRLRLVYRRINCEADSPPYGRRSAGQLYAQGDYSAASDAYEAKVIEDPGDLDAWAGLALSAWAASGSGPVSLADNPEVVTEVYRQAVCLRAEPQRPMDLARWLSAAAATVSRSEPAGTPGSAG